MGPGRSRYAHVVIVEPVIGIKGFAVPVHHRFDHRCGLEPVILANHPGSHDAPGTATGDVQPVRVDKAQIDNRIDPVHDVVIVLPRIVVVQQVGKLFPVAGAAPGIGEKDNIACCGVQLHFGGEALSVVADGTAVVLHQQRIFFVRVEVRRQHQPSLYVSLVNAALPPQFLGFSQGPVAQQVAVEVGHRPSGAITHYRYFSGKFRAGIGVGQVVIVSDGERAAAVGSSNAGAAQV